MVKRQKPVAQTLPQDDIENQEGKSQVVKQSSTKGEEGGGGDFYAIQYPVIKMIDDYMTQHPHDGKKMTIKMFAERSGVSIVNLMGVMNGHRWLARCNRDMIDKLASFLEVPVLQIFIMCGFIRAEDVVITQSLEKSLDLIHEVMMKDQAAAYRVPGIEAWNKWPLDAKLCLCMMYEAYTHKRLMRYAAVHVPQGS